MKLLSSIRFVLCCACLVPYATTAQVYPVAAIPAELKENVDVVVREDSYQWKIIAADKASTKVHFAVTILNTNGDDQAEVVVSYDKLEKISDFKVNVYDQNGSLIRKVKSSEIRDVSAFDGFSLFSDNRLKHVDVSQSTYPYTVEYEYSKEYKYMYNNQGSTLISEPKMSVQHFLYEITYPPNLAPRYKQRNFDAKPTQVKNADGTETLKWEVSNLKPLKSEPSGPALSAISPRIDAAPSIFEFSGYAGNMNTWQGLNDWIMQLNKGRDQIPETTKRKVIELTRDLKTTEQKAKVLYEYLQGKTRYVSIQLGIGGFQPFEAKVVDEVGYGDCKALSNYMVSLLKEAGINSNYTLIRAGKGAAPIAADFPSSQFNHVIVAVPNGRDTLWLECTSQTNPFGYQGGFTGERQAFMITEQGGKLVRTTNYPGERNIRKRDVAVTLLPTGDAKAKVSTTYAGLRYEAGSLNHYLDESTEEQKEWLLENVNIPNFNLDQFKMINNKSKDPTARIEANLTLNRYASVSGKRIFVTPNIMSRSTYIPEAIAERKTNVIVKMGYVDLDSVVYSIPESIYPEFVPPAIKHETRFGTYEAKFALDAGRLIYTRRLVMKEGEFPPESYKEYVDFHRNISKADNMKLVFLSKT
jgi:transglutaminase-like putative cysteine protease